MRKGSWSGGGRFGWQLRPGKKGGKNRAEMELAEVALVWYSCLEARTPEETPGSDW